MPAASVDVYQQDGRASTNRNIRRPRPVRVFYEKHDSTHHRADFLRDDYDRSGSAPLVLRPRELRSPANRNDSAPRSFVDTVGHRQRSPSRVRFHDGNLESGPLRGGLESARNRRIERENLGEERYEDPLREYSGSARIPVPAIYAEAAKKSRSNLPPETYKEDWDLSRVKDVTMHLELDVTEDLESDLDEFCHLGRLGNFHQARQLFRDNLEKHISNAYVSVQYAQMLLYIGDYKSLDALNVTYEVENSNNQLLLANLVLIQECGILQTGNDFDEHEVQVNVYIPHEGPKLGEVEYSTAGSTRIPAKAVSIRAISDLGYTYKISGDTVIVETALREESIQFLIDLSNEKYLQFGSEFLKSFPGALARCIALREAKLTLDKLQSLKHAAINIGDRRQAGYLEYRAIPEKEAIIAAYERENRDTNSDENLIFGSTECQILALMLRWGCSNLELELFDWTLIYNDLLRLGRVWDFKDIFTEVAIYYGREEAYYKFFGSLERPLDKIIRDWSTATYDEITNLALLDTLASLVLETSWIPESLGIRDIMVQAGKLASDLVRLSPGNMKSRQYIRWILAQIIVTDYRNDPVANLTESLGTFLERRVISDLDIYIPLESETVEWPLIRFSANSYTTQQMALNTIRGLGDLETEALCLKLLIAHSQDPTEIYDELIHLQKTVQNDITGWIQTCLSKYIICNDRKSCDALRDEILSIDSDAILSADLAWARSMVLRALAHSEHEENMFLEEARGYFEYLSPRLRAFMEDNKLVTPRVEPKLTPDLATTKLPTLREQSNEKVDKNSPAAVTFSEKTFEGKKETDKKKEERKSGSQDDNSERKTYPSKRYIVRGYDSTPRDWTIVDVSTDDEKIYNGSDGAREEKGVKGEISRSDKSFNPERKTSEPSTSKRPEPLDSQNIASPDVISGGGTAATTDKNTSTRRDVGLYFPTHQNPFAYSGPSTNTHIPPAKDPMPASPHYNEADHNQQQPSIPAAPSTLSKIYVTMNEGTAEPLATMNEGIEKPPATIQQMVNEDEEPNPPLHRLEDQGKEAKGLRSQRPPAVSISSVEEEEKRMESMLSSSSS